MSFCVGLCVKNRPRIPLDPLFYVPVKVLVTAVATLLQNDSPRGNPFAHIDELSERNTCLLAVFCLSAPREECTWPPMAKSVLLAWRRLGVTGKCAARYGIPYLRRDLSVLRFRQRGANKNQGESLLLPAFHH